MPQVPKAAVRDGFVASAGAVLSELGFEKTTMAAVAERASSSVGNLYKYFENKQELLRAVVPAQLVRELRRRTRARIQALGTARDVRELPDDSPYHALAADLLDFGLQHRHAVVILLARAEGTALSGFARSFVAELVAWALRYARGAYPGLDATPELRFVLTRAYESFLSGLAAALLAFPEERAVRSVVLQLTALHQGGLKNLFESQGGPDAQSRNVSAPPVVPPAARSCSGHAGPGNAYSQPVRRKSSALARPGGPGRRG